MTWKFWKWRRQFDVLEQIIEKASVREGGLVRDLREQKAAGDDLRIYKRLYDWEAACRTEPHSVDRDALAVLALADENTNWWQMFNRVLELQTRQEQLTAMMPGLSNEARHYNAGRAAALADFQEMLVKKWLESRVSQ